ncbi:response regulator transcription factor [bacterium AH-315-G11]|nr:response regulator transcription factor [bacterium AH-315-G11]
MNILIADDHALFRDGIRLLLQQLGDVSISEARNSNEIQSRFNQLPPVDLLLLDLNMPGIDSADGVGRICEGSPCTAVIVMSSDETTHVIQACMNAGSLGFIPKSLSSEVMFGAIKIVMSGERYIPVQVLEKYSVLPVSEGMSITPRQEEVWHLIIDGKSNKDIAYSLGVSENTVKQHISALFRKLNVNSRTQAIQKAHIENR